MKLLYQYNLKILALISAIILWFIVITVENNVLKYPSPIQVQTIGLGDYYALTSPLPEVTLYLKMDSTELKTIAPADIEVYVDLSEIAEGTHDVDIIANIDGSRSKVLKVEPSSVTITLSAVLQKEVPLKLEITGNPNEEFNVKDTSITPKTVKISGAKSVLDQINQINIPYEFTGNETTLIEKDITVLADNPEDPLLVTVEPGIVKLKIELESKNEEKEVSITPTFTREEDRNTFLSKLTVEPATIMIKGPTDSIKDLIAVPTQALEVSVLLRNESIEVKLVLPDGVSLVNPTQKVILKIK